MKITAVFVAYNPDLEILNKSIDIISRQVDDIVIVDNSESSVLCNDKELNDRDNVYIHILNKNLGIAKALNIGYQKAIDLQSDWVLSMDQDSIVGDNLIDEYQDFLSRHNSEKIGALMPSFYLCNNAVSIIGGKDEQSEDYMTSGSLVNLQAYIKSKGFADQLFIDMVDTDFGFKLILNGYKLFRLGSIVMHHNIGAAKDITIAGKHLFYITNHNYIRRYYITRNLLYIKKIYGNRFRNYSSPWYRIFKSIIRITAFEKDKLRKFRSIYWGIVDYKINRYDKYPH